jgi:hypothetical protein
MVDPGISGSAGSGRGRRLEVEASHVRRGTLRSVLRFAASFALGITLICVPAQSISDPDSLLGSSLGWCYFIVDFGGAVLTMLMQMFIWGLSPFGFPNGPTFNDWSDWVLLVATTFAGAFVQGLLYGLIGSTVHRVWRRHRPPRRPRTKPMARLKVDGQVFDLRPDGSEGTHYDWVNGPHRGYGFSCTSTTGATIAQHEEAILDFLLMIDPVTGHID